MQEVDNLTKNLWWTRDLWLPYYKFKLEQTTKQC